MGIPGGCRLSIPESCHNQGHDKKDTVFYERVKKNSRDGMAWYRIPNFG